MVGADIIGCWVRFCLIGIGSVGAGVVARMLARSSATSIMVLVRVLLERLDDVLRILRHIGLEVLHEVHNGEERLVVVHLVTNAKG